MKSVPAVLFGDSESQVYNSKKRSLTRNLIQLNVQNHGNFCPGTLVFPGVMKL